MTEGGGARPRVLVVDDDRVSRELLTEYLESETFVVMSAGGIRESLERVARTTPDLVICDLYLGDGDAFDLLIELRRRFPDLPAIVITGFPDAGSAQRAVEHQTYDFLEKPVSVSTLIPAARRALRSGGLSGPKITWIPRMLGLLGQSPAMRAVLTQIESYSQLDSPVLLTGEPGTGKELVARAIHRLSSRREGPFVGFQTSIREDPEQIHELFGREEPDGRDGSRVLTGRLESGVPGSIYVDEILNLPRPAQNQLLRVIEAHRFRRPGGFEEVPCDCRLLVGTRVPPPGALERGEILRELAERLIVARIELPPLCDRPEDVEDIGRHHLETTSRELGKPGLALEPEAWTLLRSRDWPGNVGQLVRFLRRLTLLADRPVIGPADLAPVLEADPCEPDPTDPDIRVGASLEEARRRMVQASLEVFSRNVSRTARVLGLDRKTVMRYAVAPAVFAGDQADDDSGSPTGCG